VQFVPPNQHRANIAERAIRRTKNTIIAAVDENLDPRVRFERVLPQAEIVINHQKACLRILSITAWEGMQNSKCDFQAHPICIYNMRAIVYENPDVRATRTNHGINGFYVDPQIHHYRCCNFASPPRIELAHQTQYNGLHEHSNSPEVAQFIDLKQPTMTSARPLNRSKIPTQLVRSNNGLHHPEHHRVYKNCAFSTA